MNSAVASVLNKVLGDFVENLNANQLNISVFSGSVNLENLRIKQDAIDAFGLPFAIKQGTIGSIKVEIPWTSLSSSPLKIEIDSVYVHVVSSPTKEWVAKNQDKRLFKEKQAALCNFELYNSAELAVVSEPGYLEKLITKVLNNLQVSITRVHIRIDDFESSVKPYCIGIILKSVSAFTCNKAWMKEFTEDGTTAYKLAQIVDISLYLDDNLDLRRTGEISTFQRLSQQEVVSASPSHRFLLQPSLVTLKLVLNKSPRDLSSPQVSAELEDCTFQTRLEAQQVTHIFKLMEFLSYYQKYCRGYEASLPITHLTEELGAEYRALYKRWKLAVLNGSKSVEADLSSLVDFETRIPVNEIIANRKIAIGEISIERVEEVKMKEATALEGSNRGVMSGFMGFFGSKAKAEQEEKERQLKLMAVKAELSDLASRKQLLREEFKELLESTESFINLPPDFVRFEVKLNFRLLSFELAEETRELIKFQMNSISFDVGVRLDTMKLALHFGSVEIADKVMGSPVYPRLLAVDSIHIAYDEYPEKRLQIRSGGAFLYYNIESLLEIMVTLQRSVASQFDVAYYAKQASSIVEDYVSSGQEYLAQIMAGQYANRALAIDFEIKAPEFIIPFDLYSDRGAFQIDLGKIKATSRKALPWVGDISACEELDSLYDTYTFELDDLLVLSHSGQSSMNLLEKASLKLTLRNCIISNHPIKPGLLVGIQLSDLKATLSDTVLAQAFALQERTLKLIESKQSASAPTELSIKTRSVDLSHLDNLIALQVDFEISAITYTLWRNDACTIKTQLARLKGQFQSNAAGDFDCVVNLSELVASDERPEMHYKRIISNPRDDDASQIEVTVSKKSQTDSLRARICVNDIRLVLCPETIALLQSFISPSQSPTATATLKNANRAPIKVSLSREVKSNISVEAQLKNFELWLPSDATRATSQLVSLSFSSDLSLAQSSVVVYKLGSDDTVISREVKLDDVKADLSVKNLLLQTGIEENTRLCHAKHLLPPTDFTVAVSKLENEFDLCQTVTFQADTIHASLGFSDLFTLHSIAQGWKKLDVVTPEKQAKASLIRVGREGYIIDCKELKFSLDDDISKRPVPIVVAKLRNIVFTTWLTRGIELAVGAELSAYFFNQKLSVWEPLLEPYHAEVWAVQETSRETLQLQFIAKSVLNLNLSYEMLHSVILLKHCLQKELEWKATNRKSVLSHELKYQVYNAIGIPIKAWLSIDPAATKRTLEQGEQWEFSDSILKELFFNAAERLRVETPDSVPVCLNLEIEQVVFRIPLSESKTFGFNIGVSFIVDVFTTQSAKVFSIESGLRFMNNTEAQLTLTCNSVVLSMKPKSYVAIPVSWLGSKVDLSDLVQSYTVDLNAPEAAPQFMRLSNANACIDQLYYSVDQGDAEMTILQVNPAVTLRNCLPGSLVMVCEDQVSLDQGQETVVGWMLPDDAQEVAWEGVVKGVAYRGLPARLPMPGSTVVYPVRNRLVTSEALLISNLSKVILQNDDLDLRFKQITRRTTRATELTVYAQYVVVNQTDNSIELSPSDTVILPHSLGLYVTDETAIWLRTIDDSVSSWSEKFSIATPGITGVVSVALDPSTSAHMGVSLMEGYGACALSKVIQVAPRFVVINNLAFPIFILPHKLGQASRVEPGQSTYLTTSSSSDGKALQLSDDGSTWSSSFYIEEIEDFVLKVRSTFEGQAWHEPKAENYYHRFIRVTITTRNEASLLIALSTPNEPEYVVSNKTGCPVILSQVEGPVWEVPSMTDLVYAYDDWKSKHKKVQLTLGSDSRVYSFDKVKRRRPLGKYNIAVIPQAGKKILVISEEGTALQRPISDRPAAKLEVDFTIAGVCVSVVDEYPKEILLFSLQRICLKGYSETVKIGTDLQVNSGFDLSIGSMQLDNLLEHPQAYPVLLAPADVSDGVPYFQLGVHRLVSFTESGRVIERFPLCTILIQETKLHIDFLTALNLTAKLVRLLESSQSSLDEDTTPLFVTNIDLAIEVPKAAKTYFEVLQLSAIKLSVSTRIPSRLPETAMMSGLFGKVLKTLLHIANITDSSLSFKSVILLHSFQPVGKLTHILAMNYAHQAVFQFYKILGSSELLGNPIGLIDNLGTGVLEFFSEPYKGLIKGPDAFVGGVAKGVKSLVGNLVSGGFGSVSKIAGSLHDIVKEVGGGDRRSDIDRQGNIIDGVTGGVLDVASGVAGLFTKPLEGAHMSGVTGFFKGIGTGVIGAVASPVAALFRVGGSVAQTIAEGGEKIKQAKPTVERGQVRYQRYIASSKQLEVYDQALAEAQHYLRRSKEYSEDSIQLCQAYQEATVILTDLHIILLREGRFAVSIYLSDVKEVTSPEVDKVVVSYEHNMFELTSANLQQISKLVLALASLK